MAVQRLEIMSLPSREVMALTVQTETRHDAGSGSRVSNTLSDTKALHASSFANWRTVSTALQASREVGNKQRVVEAEAR